MKILKIIIGTLAALFALAHVVGLIMAFASGSVSFDSRYVVSQIGGRVAGLCIGVVIAVLCFRKKKTG